MQLSNKPPAQHKTARPSRGHNKQVTLRQIASTARHQKDDGFTKRKKGFLDLPAELCNKVYRHLFHGPHPYRLHPLAGTTNLRPLSTVSGITLFSTCKQIHDEASSILYGENGFLFDTYLDDKRNRIVVSDFPKGSVWPAQRYHKWVQRLTLRVAISAEGAWYRPKAPRRHQENLRGLRAYYEEIWADKDLAIRFIDSKDEQLRPHPLTSSMARYVLPIFLPLQRQRPIDVQNLSPEVTYWFQSRILQSNALKISPTVSAALQGGRLLFSVSFDYTDTEDFVERIFPHSPNLVRAMRPEEFQTFRHRFKDFTCKAGLDVLGEMLADAEARVVVVVERPKFKAVLFPPRDRRAAMYQYLAYLETRGIRLGE